MAIKKNYKIGSVTSLYPSVGKLHFHALVGALVKGSASQLNKLVLKDSPHM